MFGIGDRVNGKACGNCPTNGCLGCPLATEYPEFSKNSRAARPQAAEPDQTAEGGGRRANLGLRSGPSAQL